MEAIRESIILAYINVVQNYAIYLVQEGIFRAEEVGIQKQYFDQKMYEEFKRSGYMAENRYYDHIYSPRLYARLYSDIQNTIDQITEISRAFRSI